MVKRVGSFIIFSGNANVAIRIENITTIELNGTVIEITLLSHGETYSQAIDYEPVESEYDEEKWAMLDFEEAIKIIGNSPRPESN